MAYIGIKLWSAKPTILTQYTVGRCNLEQRNPSTSLNTKLDPNSRPVDLDLPHPEPYLQNPLPVPSYFVPHLVDGVYMISCELSCPLTNPWPPSSTNFRTIVPGFLNTLGSQRRVVKKATNDWHTHDFALSGRSGRPLGARQGRLLLPF